jgi:uncharacterized coiled-coil DUF342 family protein
MTPERELQMEKMIRNLETETQDTTESEEFKAFLNEAKQFKTELRGFRDKMVSLKEFSEEYGNKFSEFQQEMFDYQDSHQVMIKSIVRPYHI